LLLINWYRLERVSIDIIGHTAVIGPNASGKSSLLDAVQAVLVGGDKRWWNPNASAAEKSTRSLRDYCLGVVRDPSNPDVSRELRPRDQAVTYLALVFREQGTQEPISVGLALHARLDEAQEVIDGRFVAPGLELVLSDLVDRTPEGPVPKPWRRLREDLRQRLGEPFRVFPQVGEYQRHLCALLSDGRRHLDPPRFLRAFRNAITFAPIRNVSDFVRSHILEERPIQVRSLQQALQHYREIQTRTREAQAREKALDAINRNYQRAEQAERLGLAWRWVEQEAAFNALESELEPLRQDLERLAAEIAALSRRITDLEAEWQLADNALTEANRRLAATNVEQQRERVRAEMQAAQTTLDAASRAIEDARIGLGAVHRLLDSAERLDDAALLQALQALPPLLRRDEGLLAATWPQSPGEVMAAVARIAPRVSQAVDGMLARFEQLVREEGEMARALEDLRGRITRLERGESDLQPATQRLIALLAERGIAAVPLCDRVDLADEHWRGALESFLGGHREALLVDPGQVREAVGLYRREGKRRNIHGSRVINTLKTAQWRDRRTAGSLAEMAVSDDPHALAYVNQRAGNVLRVDTEDALLRHDRAITADGMLATGGAVLRLKPEEPMLGREARRLRLAALQGQFIRDGQTHYAKQQEKAAIQDLRERQLMPLNDRLRAFPDLVSLTAARQQGQADLARLQAEEQALQDDADYRRLQAEVGRCRAERERIKAQADQEAKTLREREHTEQAQRLALGQKDAAARAVAERRGTIEHTTGFSAQLAAERLEEFQDQELFAEESPATWRALGEEAGRRAGIQERTVINQRGQARDGLTDYWAAWSSERRPALGTADDHLALSA
ncbi:MAG: ATP-binding protein, partial [Bdellovibrio bacteriovorus]